MWEPTEPDELTKVHDPQIQPRGRKRDKPDSEQERPMKKWLLADRLIYGLINVRTDGDRIVVGVMKENGTGYHTESFSV